MQLRNVFVLFATFIVHLITTFGQHHGCVYIPHPKVQCNQEGGLDLCRNYCAAKNYPSGDCLTFPEMFRRCGLPATPDPGHGKSCICFTS
ncbi:hypothetical protein DdX_03894 [Ditylenchus destructor]|uniref:Uncharacterized protein n=1 Tax=Ditylenchus destructor TaxID=166010 RepID=A0AAD4NEI3_9BILA|nr:hypothetical protein DdX_03894 [Ditylenchus destructor]